PPGRDARGREEPRRHHVAPERDDLPDVRAPELVGRDDPRNRGQTGIAMAKNPIDLRSDTVTKPSAAMRKTMAEAEAGDDVFMEDPTINRLQARSAEIFGREAALYVPSGSMGNLICLIAHTRPGQEVICEENAHVYTNEMAAISGVAGLLPRLIPTEDGI